MLSPRTTSPSLPTVSPIKVPLGGAVVVADLAEDGVPAFQAIMESVGGTMMRLPTGHFKRATD